MSYMKDIDEYDEDELLTELRLRAERRTRGVCDYCGRPPESPPCKERKRHRLGNISEALERRVLQYEATIAAIEQTLFGNTRNRSRDQIEQRLHEMVHRGAIMPVLDVAIHGIEDATGAESMRATWDALDGVMRKLKDARDKL
jgi:hypothetical protein